MSAYFLYKKANAVSDEFIETLVFANVLDSQEEERLYSADRDMVASVQGLMNECLTKSTLFLHVENDSKNIILSGLSSAVKKAGFITTEKESESAYTVNVTIDPGVQSQGTGEDTIYVSYPSLALSIVSGDKTVYSFSVKVDEKTAAYHKDLVITRALEKLVSATALQLIPDFTVGMSE